MKKLFTLLALVLCSCAETFVGEEIAKPNSENLPDLTAAFAEEGATRTYIEDGKYLRWNEDDRLTIFFGNTLNRQYKFNGQTGDNSGTFSLVPDGMLGTGNAFDRIYALYPYNADARISDEGVISLTLPAIQTYAENSFGVGVNTMVAVTENLEDTFLLFKNACGYLKLKLYNADGKTLKSVEVKGNNGEPLAGDATLNINFGEAPILTMADAATDTVVLDCGNGVALGTTADTATELWVVVPATTFADGLTIIATDTDGGVFEKSTTKEVIIERNAIQPMAALEAEFQIPETGWSEIWYTSNDGNIVNPRGSAFDASIVSNTYENGMGVIKFNGKITKIGESAFETYNEGWNERLTSIIIPEGVTTIGLRAFRYCGGLKEITLPESLTRIEERAFIYCGFESIDIPDAVTYIGVQAFDSSDLKAIVIPDNVTVVDKMAFYGCDYLESITFGNSVKEIGKQACEYCVKLTTVVIPNSVSKLGAYAFCDCKSIEKITIGSGIEEFGDSPFLSCTGTLEIHSNLKYNSSSYKCTLADSNFNEIIIGDEVTSFEFSGGSNSLENLTTLSIGSGLKKMRGYFHESLKTVRIKSTNDWFNIEFANKDSNPLCGGANLYADGKLVTEVFVPTSITKIGSYQMAYYKNLYSIYIPSNVKEIGVYAFEGCNNLSTIVIGNGVEKISYCAFRNCKCLSKVSIPGSVTTIGDSAFSGCEYLYQLNLSYGVQSIGSGAFSSCVGLSNVYIPGSVTTIGERAFAWCDYITSVTISNGVQTIKDSAFSGCKIQTLTLPESVSSIGYGAFGCSTLEKVYIKRETPPYAEDDDDSWSAFGYNNSKLTIYVPVASIDTYRTAKYWKSYANQMVAYDFVKGEVVEEEKTNGSYTVVLNNAWRQSTSVSNPDSSLYDGVYESYSNYNVDSGVATMYIDIEGYTEFSIYVRSNAESSYDYVTVSELDSTTQKMSTSGNQNSGTAISNYTKVTYTGIDGGSHRITVTYRKDGSVNNGADRGYLIIPKNQ